MHWDEERARHLTHKVDRALRQLQNGKRSPPRAFFGRLKLLTAEKAAAYETKDMERYKAALDAIYASARPYLELRKKTQKKRTMSLPEATPPDKS